MNLKLVKTNEVFKPRKSIKEVSTHYVTTSRFMQPYREYLNQKRFFRKLKITPNVLLGSLNLWIVLRVHVHCGSAIYKLDL